ncbi:MAG TPA: amidase [Vicinamibacterales bacterium]|nr:amidase [Vicinamibacterales bacterium]
MNGTARSIAESVGETIERISALNPRLNAFVSVFEADAIAQARTLDEELRQGRSRGPLHGLTVSIKDLIDVEGAATTAASRSRLDHIARSDATVVSRLRAAGAVIIGKCNLHEFALGTTSDESAFGPVRNPYDTTRSAGGSSGGSAAAVAADLGWASVGSDTGGSIRIPAAACGVVGLKPASGDIPTTGVVPLSVSLDHVGPIARNVRDAWILYGVLKGTGDCPTAPAPLSQLRLGKLGGYFADLLDEEVRRQFAGAIDRLRAAGASMQDVRVASTPEIARTYVNIVLTEAFAYHSKSLEGNSQGYSKGVRDRLEQGKDIPAAAYIEAQRVRGTLRAEVDAALVHCDALILPTLPIPAPKIGAETISIDGVKQPVRAMMLRLTQLFNLSGHPAISLPCGQTADGLPCGLQLVGKRQNTLELLATALSCEDHVTPPAP